MRQNRAPKLNPHMAATLHEATTLKIDPSTTQRHPLYRLRLIMVACAFALYSFSLGGLVFGREQLVLWIVITLVVANLGKPTSITIGAIKDWTPLVVMGLAYDYSRGAADTLGFPTQWRLPIAFDEALFGEVPTVSLQRALNMGSATHWWEAVTAVIYVSHFFVSYAVLGVLWQRNRDTWRRYFTAFAILTFSGLATYILLPTAPPWLASQDGQIGEVVRTTQNGWEYLGIGVARKAISLGQAAANDIAALPSLHLAFSALPLFMFWRSTGRFVRAGLILYPLAMGFTIVSSGEHYVFDVVAGFAYAAASALLAHRVFDRKAQSASGMPLHRSSADGFSAGSSSTSKQHVPG